MIRDIQAEILRLKKENDVCILAHSYTAHEILEVADFSGDSYALSVRAKSAPQKTVLMVGVRFMAETVKILSPEKRVLLSHADAGCPMAEQMTPDLIEKTRAQFPGCAVVAYINTTAALKTVCDVCVTSSSAQITVTLNYNSGGDHEDIMSSIQADLAAIGINVEQQTQEWAAYLDSLSDGSYDLGRLGWTADYPIQDNFLYPNFYSTAANNYNHYNNPDFDAALLAARAISDEEQRREAYREACAMVGDEMPVIPIMFYAHNYIGSERLANFFYDAATIPHFETAQFA